MDIGVKETACTRCDHREVCGYKDDFLKSQAEFDNSELGRRIISSNWCYRTPFVCKYAKYTGSAIR